MTELALRRATPADLQHLVRHRRRMWEDMGVDDGEALDAADDDYRAWAAECLADGSLHAWLFEDGEGAVVAGGAVWLRDVHPRPGFAGGLEPYLLSMYTEPAHRGQGLGGRIVEAALAWARGEGFQRITLHASEMGRSLYASAGFVDVGEMGVQLDPDQPVGFCPPADGGD